MIHAAKMFPNTPQNEANIINKNKSRETVDKKEKIIPNYATEEFEKCWNIEFLMSYEPELLKNKQSHSVLSLGCPWNPP